MTSANHPKGELEIAIVERIRDIPRDDWNALLAPDDTPFVDWDWLHAMEESQSAVRKTGWSPYHLVLRTGPRGGIVAACPLYLKSHSMGEFVFDQGWADAAERSGIRYFPKLVVGVPFTPHTGRRFLVAPGDRPANRGAGDRRARSSSFAPTTTFLPSTSISARRTKPPNCGRSASSSGSATSITGSTRASPASTIT